MHLINELYLTTDKYNYIISRRSIVEEGKFKGDERFIPIAFYGHNLKLLKKGLCEMYILENIENKSMDKLIDDIDTLIRKLEEIK